MPEQRGLTFSGWTCGHLPYLVELDNWGASKTPGQAEQGAFGSGLRRNHVVCSPEQSVSRALLRYAWDWVRRTDPNGFLQMPGSRTLRFAADGKRWYYANRQASGADASTMRKRFSRFGQPMQPRRRQQTRKRVTLRMPLCNCDEQRCKQHRASPFPGQRC